MTVLDDDAGAPEGAAVFQLVWNDGAVSPNLRRGDKKTAIGMVSRTPLANHPDYTQMRQ